MVQLHIRADPNSNYGPVFLGQTRTSGGKFAARQGRTTQQTTSQNSPFIVTTQDASGNPIFEFKSDLNASLYGPVWNHVQTFAEVKSLKIPKPYDPEPVLFVRAYSDDLKITQPVIKSKKSHLGWKNSGNKRLVALEYLKKCILEDFSLDVEGEIEQPHTMATLLRYEPPSESER